MMAKQDSVSKVHLSSFDDLFQTDESREDLKREKLVDIPISMIQDFPDHPYKVKDDENMAELVESVKTRGLNIYEKQTKEELETALSIITTSYSRDGNIIMAVQENLPHIKPPLKECFTAFIGDAMAVSSSVKQALYNLKKKVDDEIFREWVDTLIQCQDNQEMKDTLQPIVSKLTDVRIVNSELNTMMSAVRTEYYTMVGLVVGNIPLLYLKTPQCQRYSRRYG